MLEMEDRSSTTAIARTTRTTRQQHQHSNQTQAAISRLPPELLTQILNYLNYPGLSTFLSSCHLFKQFPSESFIHQVRESYINDLLAKEQSDAGYREVCAQNLVRYCCSRTTTPPINDIHQNRALKADRLVCYTCYSELPRERFTRGQITGNRSYGHGKAGRRFCIECGLKAGKWVPGTRFGRFNGNLIVCVSCRGLKGTSAEARGSKLCEECYEQGVEDRFMLRRLSQFSMQSETMSSTASTDDRSDDDEEERRSESCGTEVTSLSSSSESCGQVDLEALELGEREVICRRCWIVDHTVTKILVGEGGRPDRSLCEGCATSK